MPNMPEVSTNFSFFANMSLKALRIFFKSKDKIAGELYLQIQISSRDPFSFHFSLSASFFFFKLILLQRTNEIESLQFF